MIKLYIIFIKYKNFLFMVIIMSKTNQFLKFNYKIQNLLNLFKKYYNLDQYLIIFFKPIKYFIIKAHLTYIQKFYIDLNLDG